MHTKRLSFLCLSTSVGIGTLLLCLALFTSLPQVVYSSASPEYYDLLAAANANGTVRVIVQLDIASEPLGDFDSPQAIEQHFSQIQSAQESVLSGLSQEDVKVTADLKTIPYIGLEVSAEGLAALQTSPEVVNIQEDVPVPPALDSSGDVIGRPAATAHGLTGEGVTVAILDTGVDITHDAFKDRFGNSRIVSEACYSSNFIGYNSVTVCPDGSEESTAPGSGDDCQADAVGFSDAQDDCEHGTHVAGIAAGQDVNERVYGVAPDANIIAIQVFSLFKDGAHCSGASNCMLSFTSDQILGLERVYELRNTFNIASANMSLGGGSNPGYCDSDARKAIIDNLASAGIATVIAAGNNGYTNTVGTPSCISTAITVGSTNDNDTLASYSNLGPQIDLLAPGSSIYAAIPGNEYGTKSGTSMATPQVAGAWALLKQIDPDGTVLSVQTAFSTTGTILDDQRTDGVMVDMPRINLLTAADSLAPGLQTSISLSGDYFLPGDPVTATITISNNLAFTANNVVITGSIDSGFLLNPSSLSGDGSYETVNDQTVITWTTNSNLDSDSSLTRVITGFISDEVTAGGYISSTFGTEGSNLGRTGTLVKHSIINTINRCGFTESFEDGELDFAWSTDMTNEGRVRVVSERSSDGSYSMALDDSVANSTYSEFQAILTLDLGSAENINFSFDWNDLGDEYNAAYDGVFIRSNPAATWVKILDFAGDSSDDVFNNASIDLSSEAVSAGVALSSNFQIRFSGYDNFPASFESPSGGDGYLIDNIELTCDYVLEPLALSGSATTSTVKVGEETQLSFDLTNLADSDHTGLTITATIPAEASVASTISILGGSDSGTDSIPVLFENGTLEADKTMSITIPISISEGVAAGEIIAIELAVSGDKLTATQRISVPLTITNTAPTASDETVFPAQSGPLTFNVATNDSDPNGDTLIVSAIGTPSFGTATFITQTVTYTPVSSFKGGEAFTYTISDQNGGDANGLLTVIVPNSAPTAVNDVVTKTIGTPITINPLANDTDPNFDTLVIESVTPPSVGTASISGTSIIFTATGTTTATAVFNYVVSDQDGGTDAGTISVVMKSAENEDSNEEEEEEEEEEQEEGADDDEETFTVDPESPTPQTLDSQDGEISLEIPAGSLPEESKTLLIAQRSQPSSQLPIKGAGVYFDLNLEDDTGAMFTQPFFDPPLQITLEYNEALLNGIPEASLQLYFFDTDQARWIPIPIVSRDTVLNTITAELEHFTEFALADQYVVYLPAIRR